MLKEVRKAALAAAGYLRLYWKVRGSSKVVGKGSFGDVTKDFDKVAEDIIIGVLRSEFNDEILVVSEELGVNKFSDYPRYVFIIDPVDGSTNYDSGFPWVSVVIGGARYREGGVSIKDLEVAIVADVFGGRIFEFSSGSGVKVNGYPAVRRDPPSKVLLGYFEVPDSYGVVPAYWRLRGRRAALRSLGSAALDIVHVGLGAAEGFIDARAKLRNVDVAAALKIAFALGAKGFTCGGKPAEEIKVDSLVRVSCIGVGFDGERTNMLLKAFRSTGLLTQG